MKENRPKLNQIHAARAGLLVLATLVFTAGLFGGLLTFLGAIFGSLLALAFIGRIPGSAELGLSSSKTVNPVHAAAGLVLFWFSVVVSLFLVGRGGLLTLAAAALPALWLLALAAWIGRK